MSFRRPTLLQMGMHEAGHAYAYASIIPGEIPVEMGLEDTPEGLHGWSKRLKVAETEAADLVTAKLGEDGAERWFAAAETAISLAGPLAEARQREGSSAAGLIFLGSVLPQLLDPALPAIDHDFGRIRAMLDVAFRRASVDTAQALLRQTGDILDACWPGVRRLGRRLVDERRLGAAALSAHFARWPAGSPGDRSQRA